MSNSARPEGLVDKIAEVFPLFIPFGHFSGDLTGAGVASD
jgi:hypothetical protein